jgi:hypothetical protein
MKKFKINVVVLSFFLAISIQAQNIKEEKNAYTYIKKPLTPLNKEIKNYLSFVSNGFDEENNRKQADYQKELQLSQANYEKELAIYQEKMKEAQETYRAEVDAYNKRSLGRALIDGQTTKPVLREPSRPYKQSVQAPILKTGYDNVTLASTYIYLSGYQKAQENALKIEVILYGFDCTQPRVSSIQKDYTSIQRGVSSTSKRTFYYIEYSYRHPMAVRVITPDGKELLYVTPQELNNYKIYKSSESETYPNINAPLLLKSTEEEVLQKNLTFINELVNDKFGFQTTNRNATLCFVKSKKEDYQDLLIAFNEAISGLNMLTQDTQTSKAKLMESVKYWQSAINESDVNNKKARIDKDVTIAVYFNLLEVYFALENYVDAEAVIIKLNTLNLSFGDRKTKQDFEKAFVDLKKRVIINQQ